MRLKITMNSGRTYKTYRLMSYSIKYNDCNIVSLEISPVKHFHGKGVQIGTINLLKIEAIEKI
ncbi:hypothetical protein KAR91_02295 [Candidatus Pacearchaeota archaeon]|nr:hypothetical protein [Candidatus Pacearchaeota archaeon]